MDDDDDDDAVYTAGVKLRDPEDTDSLRADIETNVLDAMKRYANGYEYNGVRLELDDLHYADKPKYSLAEQREAQLSDRSLVRRLRGTVRLVDAATNQVLDKRKNVTLARVPYLTQRGTFMHGGTEYAPIAQSRLLPGAYARRRDNGELELHFNSRAGTGPAMRVTLDPLSGQYRLKIGTSDLHAYSVFKDLGVTDDELERRWGPEVLEINRAKYSKDALDRAYLKAVPKWQRDPKLDRAAKMQAVIDALNRTQVAESVLKQNLPNLFSREKAAAWRAAGRALEKLAAHRAACETFEPDLQPEEVWESWGEMDFDAIAAVKEAAAFEPDLAPGDMRDAYNSIYGGHGPRLASMRQWPEHWLDSQDTKGWLQWYENYAAGRRSDQDDRQIARWIAFKKRHGEMFRRNPTPRRAYALRNWAIDPLKLLPDGEAQEMLKAEMDRYRRTEHAKWMVRRHDFDQNTLRALLAKATQRGAEALPETPRSLMRAAAEGWLTVEDLLR